MNENIIRFVYVGFKYYIDKTPQNATLTMLYNKMSESDQILAVRFLEQFTVYELDKSSKDLFMCHNQTVTEKIWKVFENYYNFKIMMAISEDHPIHKLAMRIIEEFDLIREDLGEFAARGHVKDTPVSRFNEQTVTRKIAFGQVFTESDMLWESK